MLANNSYLFIMVELINLQSLKAHTHRPILRGFAAESAVEAANSIPELADSTT